ncbi:hypothetical protein BH23VER1_BH23VER1_03190 [soil metagenome]
MWKRIIYEEWHSWVPVAAFILTAVIFIILTARAILMGRERARHMANKPLEDDQPSPDTKASTDRDDD